MSNTRSLPNRFAIFSSTLVGAVNLSYGAVGATHSIAELAHQPLPLSDIESSLFHTFPYLIGFGSVVGVISNLTLMNENRKGEKKEGQAGRYFEYMVGLTISVLTLAASIYEGQSQVIGTGLAAFQLTCDALVLGSLVQLLFLGKKYRANANEIAQLQQAILSADIQKRQQLEKSNETLKSRILLGSVLTLAWAAFALSHVAGLAVAAPLLVAVGYVLLGGVTAVRLKNLYDAVYPSAKAPSPSPSPATSS